VVVVRVDWVLDLFLDHFKRARAARARRVGTEEPTSARVHFKSA
jgi:hypothetical protein